MAGLAASGSLAPLEPLLAAGFVPVLTHTHTCIRAFHPAPAHTRPPTQALEPNRRLLLRCESLRPCRSSRASRRERQASSA